MGLQSGHAQLDEVSNLSCSEKTGSHNKRLKGAKLDKKQRKRLKNYAQRLLKHTHYWYLIPDRVLLFDIVLNQSSYTGLTRQGYRYMQSDTKIFGRVLSSRHWAF